MKKYLAVVSGEKELSALERLRDAGLGGTCQLVVIRQHSVSVAPEDFLNHRDIKEIEKKASFFARNWYRFDKQFEEKSTFNGINLGFVHENGLFNFFRTTFLLLKAILTAIDEEKPDAIIADRKSFAGEAVKAVAKARHLDNVWFRDLNAKSTFPLFPNFSKKNLKKKMLKLRLILPELVSLKRREKDKKTVFIRGISYLGNLRKELQKDNSLNVVSLDEFLLKKILLPWNAVKYFSTRSAMQKQFSLIFSDFMAGRAFGKKFVFGGINFGKMLNQQFQEMIKRDWPEFVFLIDVLSRLFDSEKPDVMAVWVDAVPFERICVLLARQRKAKSIVVQHGALKATIKGDWIRAFAPLTADIIAVWGEQSRRSLVEHHVPKSKIVVTGAPRIDLLHNKKLRGKALRKKLGIASGEKMVLFAPQLSFDKAKVKDVVSVFDKLPKVRLVLKVHPVDDVEGYESMAGKKTVVLQNIPNYGLNDLLDAADAVITQASTVGLEAMILHKPVIVFGKRQPLDSVYYSTDSVLRARDAAELGKALGIVLGDCKERRELMLRAEKFIVEIAFKQDGKATERAIALIKSML